MTSTLGFEALLRGKPVTTLGAPFYAGWGLTTDSGRRARPADGPARPRWRSSTPTLIAYPALLRSGHRARPAPPEVIVERLAAGRAARAPRGRTGRWPSCRARFATWAWLWRT